MVGFWATVALNIPDFTRYAKSQKAQMVGQALGLPAAMTLYSFIGVAVTSASVVLFGEAIWDPVALLGRFNQPVVAFIALVALLIATLNTNVAANVVSPSNDFSNLNPRLISFRTGGLITGVVGVLMMPWKLLTDFSSYIFGWLVGYSGLLGPIAGVMIADYFLVRHSRLQGGRSVPPQRRVRIRQRRQLCARWSRWRWESPWRCWDWLFPPLRWLYDYAWFVGFGVSGGRICVADAARRGACERSGIGGRSMIATELRGNRFVLHQWSWEKPEGRTLAAGDESGHRRGDRAGALRHRGRRGSRGAQLRTRRF